ncbi:MAG: response regulator, partial [Pseudomonadales bacterium]|nr:response regulator [Pseudomonadales bacterium]
GLATVYGIVKQNEGGIEVITGRGEGARFCIYLPRHRIEEAPQKPEESRPALQAGTETILLVEDEESLLSLGKRLLERLGYTVLATDSPEEALQIAKEYEGEIHLLLTDVVMPKMNGRDLWRQVVTIRPAIKALFMSGYTADAIVHHGVLDEDVMFIQKPYTAAGLGQKIRDALDD